VSDRPLPIDNLLRLGLFRDRPVFEAAQELFGPIVVPAHIAAHSPDGLWGFMKGVGPKAFIFDPMTYWLWLPPKFWLRGSEAARGPDLPMPVDGDQIRPAFAKLLDAYGLLDAATQADDARFRSLALERLPSTCLDFQRRGIAPRTSKAVSKYAAILGIPVDDEGFNPSRLVAPYRPLDAAASLTDQRALNLATLGALGPTEKCWAVVALDSPQVLRSIGADQLSELGVDNFTGVGLWVGGLDEHHASADDLRRYRALIRSIGRPVWLMFAGYFGVLLSYDGVREVSHGVFYTESKRLQGPVGSGPPAERYYIEALHRFYEPTRAFQILELIPEFECPCSECPDIATLRAASVSARTDSIRRMDWIQSLQRHFLRVRRREIEAVAAAPREELLQDLADVKARVEAVPRSLRSATGLEADHLGRWLDALG
jgi:hypothetical protein